MSTVTAAEELSRIAHLGQLYGDQPYIVHPADVANRVKANGPNAVMAAWLHDVVEDTDITLEDLRLYGFPDEVVDAVDAVTRRPDETYTEFIRRAARHPLGRIIKLADNASNTAKLDQIQDEERRTFLTERYAGARRILATGA